MSCKCIQARKVPDGFEDLAHAESPWVEFCQLHYVTIAIDCCEFCYRLPSTDPHETMNFVKCIDCPKHYQ